MTEEVNFKTTNGKIQNSNDVRIDEFAKGKTRNDVRGDADLTTITSPAKNCVTDVNCNTAWTDATNHTLTDAQLFHLCKKYGENARLWRQKFAGLLPEVFHRRLYEKKGFGSIFEFAAKLAGMSQEQVRRVLNLERRFEDKPVLKNLLINGEVSANKLLRIASIATAENQMDLANYVQVLSQKAIETFVKDEKNAIKNDEMGEVKIAVEISGEMVTLGDSLKNQNGLQEPLFDAKSVRAHTLNQSLDQADFGECAHVVERNNVGACNVNTMVKIMEKLSPEVQKQLLELVDKNIDINKIILSALENREAEIARAKEEVAAEINCCACDNSEAQVSTEIAQGEAEIEDGVCGCVRAYVKMGGDVEKSQRPIPRYKKTSRYIPAKIQKIINAEQGDKCSVPNCKNRAQVTHHELPFAIARNHNPNNLQKLCRAHHELKHMVDVRFYEARRGCVRSG
jgi:hypothetical protein